MSFIDWPELSAASRVPRHGEAGKQARAMASPKPEPMCLSEGCTRTNYYEPLDEEEIEEVKHMSRTAEQSAITSSITSYAQYRRYYRTRKNVRVMEPTVRSKQNKNSVETRTFLFTTHKNG